MRRALVIAIVFAALAWAGDSRVSAQSFQVIDRIVAVVNRTPILASDRDEELRVEALLDGRDVAETQAAREAAEDRLIDQMLIEQQMAASKYVPAGEEETQAAIEQVQKQIAPDAQQWAAALRRYGLSEKTVADHVKRQVNQLRYVELRFQSEAHPAPDAVQRYYDQEYVPRVRAAAGNARPLAEVRDQIEQILTEQRIDQLLASWLQTLRSQAQIERRASETGGAGTQASGSE